ncbi:serine protease inhibitor 77Ba-like [Cydia splendana]|uniref:serine protease inhibitor 77Ba-like n=1 Tax=Cydia splendana TaxID=1100963 RepID=UPI0028F4B63C
MLIVIMFIYVLELCACFVLCFGQNHGVKGHNEPEYPTNLHNGLSEATGNFSVELLYHAAKRQGKQNLILSPITAWTVLAVTSEGALGSTRTQLVSALRIKRNRTVTRHDFQEIARWLVVNTTTVHLAKFNGIFVDKSKSLEDDFRQSSKAFYDTQTVDLDFRNSAATAATINGAVSSATKGRIPKLVDESNLSDAQMIITSAVYFKGQWTAPFNVSSTTKQNFYNSNGTKIGEVNMMYNRYTYPFANIKEIQARVIELPYGVENRLSMLLMLPNPGITLEDMFLNFKKVPLDTVFQEMKLSQEEYSDDEIDCFIPRFKIDSSLELNEILKEGMGIYDLFDPVKANLGRLARVPMYVSRVVHKAEIEVTEEGTTASGATAAEFANRIGVIRFEANRPFSYLIVEKVTNTIVFGGVYQQPILY